MAQIGCCLSATAFDVPQGSIVFRPVLRAAENVQAALADSSGVLRARYCSSTVNPPPTRGRTVPKRPVRDATPRAGGGYDTYDYGTVPVPYS